MAPPPDADTTPADVWADFDFTGSLVEVTRRATIEVERRKIQQVLAEVEGNRGRAAEMLGVTFKGLNSKIREYRIE
jgi:DNA-binding NtrC family response regulator